jgi:hypothetical protein
MTTIPLPGVSRIRLKGQVWRDEASKINVEAFAFARAREA